MSRMNEATLRRLQERMAQEGYKEPEEEQLSMEDDPAAENDNCSATQHRTIYTEPTQTSTSCNTPAQPQQQQEQERRREDESERYARQLREQERLLQQFMRPETGSSPTPSNNNNNNIEELAAELAKTNLEAGPSEGSGSSSVVEELWKCDHCGYESPLLHRFCGLCGSEKPEDWWCNACHYENSAYHRFCGMCGQSRPNERDDLGYEDLGLDPDVDPDDEAAIQNTVARMSQRGGGGGGGGGVPNNTVVPAPGSTQWDDDDVLTFAEESCCDAAAPQPPSLPQQQQQPPQKPQQQQVNKAWSCEVCTFLNENPMFMCCEMCGSARPTQEGGLIETEPSPQPKQPQQPQQPQQQPVPRRNSNASETSSKKKEKRITELMRQHQLEQYNQQQGGGGNPTQGGQNLPEPETDHELALIYAQQERILAQYQQEMQQR